MNNIWLNFKIGLLLYKDYWEEQYECMKKWLSIRQ